MLCEMLMMHEIPLPICRIVYRYLYDVVMKELINTYGITLELYMTQWNENCTRVKDDCCKDLWIDRYRVWRFSTMVMVGGRKHIMPTAGLSLWNALLKKSQPCTDAY